MPSTGSGGTRPSTPPLSGRRWRPGWAEPSGVIRPATRTTSPTTPPCWRSPTEPSFGWCPVSPRRSPGTCPPASVWPTSGATSSSSTSATGSTPPTSTSRPVRRRWRSVTTSPRGRSSRASGTRATPARPTSTSSCSGHRRPSRGTTSRSRSTPSPSSGRSTRSPDSYRARTPARESDQLPLHLQRRRLPRPAIAVRRSPETGQMTPSIRSSLVRRRAAAVRSTSSCRRSSSCSWPQLARPRPRRRRPRLLRRRDHRVSSPSTRRRCSARSTRRPRRCWSPARWFSSPRRRARTG